VNVYSRVQMMTVSKALAVWPPKAEGREKVAAGQRRSRWSRPKAAAGQAALGLRRTLHYTAHTERRGLLGGETYIVRGVPSWQEADISTCSHPACPRRFLSPRRKLAQLAASF
jgi:hypothetical protein